MIIKTVTKGDFPQLLGLYRHHLDPNDKDITVENALQRWVLLKRYAGSDIFVASIDDTIVATCTLVVIPNLTRGGAPYALIENVVTHADYRQRGFGTAVLKGAINTAWQAGCYKVMLLTGSKKAETLRFYGKVGFEQSKTGFQIRALSTG